MDDPFHRFATSAFDPERPFDRSAPPTHWIFVDRSDLARIVHVMCGGALEAEMLERCDPDIPVKPVEAAPAVSQPATGLLRLETVGELTGMSRSTIYAKVAKNTFPEPLRLGSRLSRWRRHEVEEWLSAPT